MQKVNITVVIVAGVAAVTAVILVPMIMEHMETMEEIRFQEDKFWKEDMLKTYQMSGGMDEEV